MKTLYIVTGGASKQVSSLLFSGLSHTYPNENLAWVTPETAITEYATGFDAVHHSDQYTATKDAMEERCQGIVLQLGTTPDSLKFSKEHTFFKLAKEFNYATLSITGME